MSTPEDRDWKAEYGELQAHCADLGAQLNALRRAQPAPEPVNARLLEALRRADEFITNGIALGFIRMPDAETPDTAHDTPGIVRAAIAAATAQAQLAAVPVAWDWLRGVMDGIPTREERIGGQRQQYVAKEAVMGWLAEGQSRAERAAQAPAVLAPAVPQWLTAELQAVCAAADAGDGGWVSTSKIRKVLAAAPHPQAEQPAGGAR